jgi:hypothetical protein
MAVPQRVAGVVGNEIDCSNESGIRLIVSLRRPQKDLLAMPSCVMPR